MFSSAALSITPIPAFADNYIWALTRGARTVVVDPGDAAPVLAWLAHNRQTLAGVLVTHHHHDHTGGVGALLAHTPVPVYGPHNPRISNISHRVGEGDSLTLVDIASRLDVIEVPGHTLDHIAYVAKPAADQPPFVLCGDTLFAAGCGRLFEGTPAQMHASLSRLAALPPATAVYCTHEYTLANLRFALAVEPDNAALHARALQAQATRGADLPTLPSDVALELATNPFLRCDVPAVAAAAAAQAGTALTQAVDVFTHLRAWKNRF